MFFGTHDNKIDRKGRVSVPATFRSKFGDPGGNAIVAFPSFTDQAIEVWTVERMQQLQDGLDPFDRRSALSVMEDHREKGQILTGLIYIDRAAPELHEVLDTVHKPLNQLGARELCPGSSVLENINSSLR